MDYFLYFYNIILVLIYGLLMFLYFQLFVQKKERLHLWLALLFSVYLVDELYYSSLEFIKALPVLYQEFPIFNRVFLLVLNMIPYDPRLPSPCPAFQKRARSDGTLQLLSARSYFFAVFYCNTAVGIRLSNYNQFPAPYLDDLS